MGTMERLPHSGEVLGEDGSWKQDGRANLINSTDLEPVSMSEPRLVASADNMEGLRREETQPIDLQNDTSHPEADVRGSCSAMTFADFVGSRFVPEHVLHK